MSPLTLIILLPLLAAVGVAFVPRSFRLLIRFTALLSTFVPMIVSLALFVMFDTAQGGVQFGQKADWVPSLGIQFYVGVDGINVCLVLLATIVAFAAACVSWEIQQREKEYYILLLLMAGGIMGAFASLDLFLFYFFHELALVPTFIMIGVWGRGADKNYATFKITLYLSLGALIALIGLIALYQNSGLRTFDMIELARQLKERPLSTSTQQFIFPWLMFGFGILVSLWPFHTWAPLGYGAAPTAVSMLHAGVLKKFGLYGLIRVALPMLPEGAASWVHWLVALSLGNIIYCGFVAMRQKDLNLLIGNSSVAHMGFAFLGIASFNVLGVTGAVVVMVAHGLLAALSFGLTGYLYQTAKTLEMDRLGGLLRGMPFVGTVSIMAMMAGCGLPGFANFVGEAMVFFGIWKVYPMATVAACWGALVIGAVYMLRAVRVVWHGASAPIGDAGTVAWVDAPHWWRRLPYLLLLSFLILFGAIPRLLTDKIQPEVARLLPVQKQLPVPSLAVKSSPSESPKPFSPAPLAAVAVSDSIFQHPGEARHRTERNDP